MKWVAEFDAGMSGTSGQDVFEANTREEAEMIAYDIALDWASSYFSVIDDDLAGTEEYPDDEEYSTWILESSIDWHICEYNPEEDGEWEA